MRYLIVTSNYFPEPTGIGLYSTDLARVLKSSGNNVSVITSLPHYPWWKIPLKFSHYKPGFHEEGGISVYRSSHFIPSVYNLVTRARYEVSIFCNFLKIAFKLRTEQFDFIISYTPTVASAIVGNIMSSLTGANHGIVVQDLSGIGAAQAGLKGGKIASLIAEKIEIGILNRANTLVVVSNNMYRYLIKKGIPEKKLKLILNYAINTEGIIEVGIAREKTGIPKSKIVLLHAGNMGFKQDLENIIHAAKILEPNRDIRFLFLGNGNQQDILAKMVENLSNIEILPTVDQEIFSYYLASADILILNERATQLDMSLPSKLTTYLFHNRPILAAVSKVGATAEFLENMAYLVNPGDPVEFANAVNHLIENPLLRKTLANHGLKFASEFLLPEKGHLAYQNWIRDHG